MIAAHPFYLLHTAFCLRPSILDPFIQFKMLEINEGCAKITSENKLGKKKGKRNEYLIHENNTLIAQL